MFKKSLSKVKPYVPGKPIEEVKRALGLSEVYKLASNEVPFSPFYIRKAINEEIKNINRYPESSCFYLRKELARQLKAGENQIIFGNGSDELITLVLRAVIEPGDEVIIAQPTFLIYEIQALACNAVIKRIPLRDFRYDLDAMAAAVTKKTRIIFIANPDNPTGTYVNHRQVAAFLNKIPKNILVFFDEAYFEFSPADFPQTKKFMENRGNIIFSRTFSKIYGLAGLRLGYAVAPEGIVAGLDKIREPFNVNRFAQIAAIAAIKDKSFIRKVLPFVKKEKEYFYREMDKLGLEYIKSATNFVLVPFKRDTIALNDYLLKNGVIIRELSGWGLKNCFRVTVGLHKENKKFIEYLKNYLKEQ